VGVGEGGVVVGCGGGEGGVKWTGWWG
jgi:hypothetical protein